MTKINSKIKQFIKRYWQNIIAILAIAVIAQFSICLINNTLLIFHKRYFLIDILLWFIIFKFFQSITNNYWGSLIVTNVINFLFITVTKLKLQYRNEPLLPSDIKMIEDLPALMKMIPFWVVVSAGGVVVIVVLLYLCLARKISTSKLNRKWRFTWITLFLIIFGSSFFWNRNNTLIKASTNFVLKDRMFWDQTRAVKERSPLIQFLTNVDVSVMNKPNTYSRDKIYELTNRYEVLAESINQHRKNEIGKQNIIFNLSESFADPNRVPGVSLSANPIPRIDKIKQNTTSGLMMSSGYGGGTANMEYMALTGFATCNFSPTLNSPYSQLVPSQKYTPTFLNDFKYKIAIHPYTNEFYNRKQNYKKFGFDKFYCLNDKSAPIKHKKKIGHTEYQSDETAYKNVLDKLHTHRKGQFINLITMQNHLPYDHIYRKMAVKAHVSNLTSEDEIENFATGINYTDKVVASALKKIQNMKQPITWVFYGDHLPGIYKNNMKKDGLRLHETDYFIYSNKAAQKQGAKDLVQRMAYVSPSNFIAMTLAQTNSKVTPYEALLTKVWQELPAFSVDSTGKSSAPQFINEHGKVVKYSSFTKKQKQLWHDYLFVQYDLTAGKNYLKDSGMMASVK